MKEIAIAWIALVAIAMIVLGIWLAMDGSPLMPSAIMIGAGGLMFVLGVMLTRGERPW